MPEMRDAVRGRFNKMTQQRWPGLQTVRDPAGEKRGRGGVSRECKKTSCFY